MAKLLADVIPLGNLSGVGPLGNSNNPYNFNVRFTDVLSLIIGVLTVVGALWFLVQLFLGAIGWIGAGSDKQALDNAKKKITNAVMGLFIVVIAYVLIGVVGFILGIDIINLGATIANLKLP